MAGGVKRYHTLRDTSDVQLGAGGSPVVVASVMSTVVDVRYGNGPVVGTTSAAPHWSLAGGMLGRDTRTCTAVLPPVGGAMSYFHTRM